MRRTRGIRLVALACILAVAVTTGCAPSARVTSTSSDAIASAYAAKRSGVQVTGTGVVERVLADDTNGDRHQRFILRLPSGQTVLVAHNIDIAPRVSPIGVGDTIEFEGVYEYNAQGGTVHWTHHDPGGTHQAGWLKRDEKVFQ